LPREEHTLVRSPSLPRHLFFFLGDVLRDRGEAAIRILSLFIFTFGMPIRFLATIPHTTVEYGSPAFAPRANISSECSVS
jgi:hypothetical protein